MKMQKLAPISNWKDGWRFWSTRLQVAGIALLGIVYEFSEEFSAVWELLPPSAQDMLPEGTGKVAVYATLVASLLARFVRQYTLPPVNPTPSVDEDQ